MIILFILTLQLFLMLSKTKFEKALTYTIIAITIWNVGFLTILQLELTILGTSTYGSDESEFFQKILYASNLENWFAYVKSDYNFSYLLFGTLILKTSWFDSIYLIRLGNVLLVINAIVVIYFFAKNFLNIRSKNLYWLLLFIGLNGMITWTAIRNLKDTLFVFALVIFIYVLFDIILKKKLSAFNLTVFTITFYILIDIRQWFIYLFLLLVIAIFSVSLLKQKRYLLFTIICTISLIFTIMIGKDALDMYLLYSVAYSENFGDNQLSQVLTGSFFGLPLSMGRFILGPGPIRGLFGSDAFLTFTATGNVLITLGSLIFWFFMPLFFLALVSKKNIMNNYIILIILLFYWIIYSYAYAGSGDTRLRAVLYILCAIYTLPYLEDIKEKKFLLKYLAILIPIFLIGSYFSYQTLI